MLEYQYQMISHAAQDVNSQKHLIYLIYIYLNTIIVIRVPEWNIGNTCTSMK